MTIQTTKPFQRIHNNGSVLINVPEGTELTVSRLYGEFYKVEASKPVGRWGERVFNVNQTEFKQLVGE